jgi:hypothetical protein
LALRGRAMALGAMCRAPSAYPFPVTTCVGLLRLQRAYAGVAVRRGASDGEGVAEG